MQVQNMLPKHAVGGVTMMRTATNATMMIRTATNTTILPSCYEYYDEYYLLISYHCCVLTSVSMLLTSVSMLL